MRIDMPSPGGEELKAARLKTGLSFFSRDFWQRTDNMESGTPDTFKAQGENMVSSTIRLA